MAYREFEDEAGLTWRVWDVYPSRPERRAGTERRGEDREGSDRRRFDEPRVVLAPELLNGWLCFETGSERRRLIPVPDGWADAPTSRLLGWLAQSTPSRSRRLVE